jgi:capsular exopolysaccharide synthesis family protein
MSNQFTPSSSLSIPAEPGHQKAPSNPLLNGVQAQGFDIWGPLQRRKYLITLFCLIGAALGYLYYLKTPKVYASSTQLMITTQAPPSLVEGNVQLDKVSLSKHASLLSSELVLGNASVSGSFSSMETFRENPFPIISLKEDMIRVVSDTDETLQLVCMGPNKDDLPIILNRIVDAYKKIIIEDSQTIGQQTSDLVEKLATKLSDEKQGDEAKWLELRKKLNISTLDEQGNVANPYSKQLLYLQSNQAEFKSELRDIQDRAGALAVSLRVDPTTNVIDPLLVKVAALEAQEFLGLEKAAFKDVEGIARNNVQPEINKRSSLEQRAWSIETKITELRFERAKRSDVFGQGHKSITALDEQIEVFTGLLAETNSEVKELDKYIQEQTPDEQISPAEAAVSEEKFRGQERREWITMYQSKLEKEQARLVSRLEDVNEEIEIVEKNSGDVAMGIIELNMLQRQIDTKDKEVNSILERLAEMNILANNYTKTKVRTLDQPKLGEAVAPSLLKSLALGSMLAFLAGLGLAVLIDQSELSFRSPHEILEKLNVPVVGRIPRINIRKVNPAKGNPSLVVAHNPSATASESFRDVRTGLFFRSNIDGTKTVLFTSPSPGDGKSTTIANLAISIAQAGKSVVLMDADFRRPRIHQYFDEEIEPGLLDVLSGELKLKDAIRPTVLQENLFLLTTGGRPKNPGELVTSEAFKELINALRGRFDYVLIDSPPVLPVSDPATIASMVDAVYMVTRIRKGVKLTAQKAKDTLDAVNANWMGIIVNGIDENPHYSEYGYQYGSYSYYGGRYGRYYDSTNKAYRDKVDAKD